MTDPFADAFQVAAEAARRRPMDAVLSDIRERIDHCERDGHSPDVLVIMRCDDGEWWTHNGTTTERAIYMMRLAEHQILSENEG